MELWSSDLSPQGSVVLRMSFSITGHLSSLQALTQVLLPRLQPFGKHNVLMQMFSLISSMAF